MGMSTTKVDYRKAMQEAHEAGMKAGEDALPTPMIVEDTSRKKQYFVGDGACGFAWVYLRDGRSAFARWLRENTERGGRKMHPRGCYVKWVGEFGQSVARKEAYARAYAEVLNKHGIEAFSGSRLD